MLNYKDFIRSYTKLQCLSFVPEIRLFLNGEKTLHNILKQELGSETPRPYWSQSWAGGLALSRYIIDNPSIVQNKHIIDFCSGSGVVGIAAGFSGAKRVTCVDTDPIALCASLLNAKANGVIVDTAEQMVGGDLVLAGDPEVLPCVFDTLRNVDFYLGCPVRNKEYIQGFDVVRQFVIDTEEDSNIDTYILRSVRKR